MKNYIYLVKLEDSLRISTHFVYKMYNVRFSWDEKCYGVDKIKMCLKF